MYSKIGFASVFDCMNIKLRRLSCKLRSYNIGQCTLSLNSRHTKDYVCSQLGSCLGPPYALPVPVKRLQMLLAVVRLYKHWRPIKYHKGYYKKEQQLL